MLNRGASYHLNQLLQEGHQLEQLIVILVHEPALYGNPIGQLLGTKTCLQCRKSAEITHTQFILKSFVN